MLQTLDGPWLLAPDPANRGREEQWFTVPRQDAQSAYVPGIIQQVIPDYHGVAWYWHTFRPQRSLAPGERYLLCFGAVDYRADVWLNSLPIGGHEGGETPFILDVTEALQPAADNLLVVRVLNPADDPIDGIRLQETPHRNKLVTGYQPGAMYNYGGILLPVELRIAPDVRIVDLFARPIVATGQILVRLTVRNDTGAGVRGQLRATVGPAKGAAVVDTCAAPASFAPAESEHELVLTVVQPRLWDINDPYLYRIDVTLETEASDGRGVTHTHTVTCGFRDFRLVEGFFRLNNRRIFVRSTHTGNHVPIGQVVPLNSDLLRRDLVYAKAAGFNMVRFIASVAWPEQLDLCDEIGLMVYEESSAGWCLADSPQMVERYDQSVREMVLRDRNHPCVTIWGMLNETSDGPVFRHAVEALSVVRVVDETRLVLLNSGRFDGQLHIGSASNPGNKQWEHVWSVEAPDAPPATATAYGGYFEGAGDAHVYPHVPQSPQTNAFLRTLGDGTKPVFLSEYGAGSLFNAIREHALFEQVGARPDLADAALARSMADRLVADWARYTMDGVYADPEDMLRDSQRLHACQRLLGFDLIRSNPNICGYNLTGMLDHAMTGEGLWTFWREWKPGIMDALTDGWAALRWCLFCDPLHSYVDRPLKLEAVIANEDVLAPGSYPVRLRLRGPHGVAWERATQVSVPAASREQDGPLAIATLCEEVSLDGPAGNYQLTATMQRGGYPAGGRLRLYRSARSRPPNDRLAVTVWGVGESVERWLTSRGITCRPITNESSGRPEILVIGDDSSETQGIDGWRNLMRRVWNGAAAVFLAPSVFMRDQDTTGWLPLASKGRCYAFNDWLYHKETVAKAHPIWEGLPEQGILDADYYGPVIPQYLFDGQDVPHEVAAAAFAVGYSCPGGYASGLVHGVYRFGGGCFTVTTLRVLENLDQHPAADRLLINMLTYAARRAADPAAACASDVDAHFARIGYH